MTVDQIHPLFLASSGVSTDTRKIKKNTIFFALKGDRFNGNAFATKAIEQGAKYAIIDEKEFQVSDQHILVNNVLQTLQELSSYHRKYLKLPIIALTGSNGKTTTKELINAVLSSTYNTKATIGNLNNHIGVPLTLLSMNTETEIGIVEMGANHLKEIEFLCTIAQPNYGYITNIGKAHLEGFGSLEGVLQGKTELYKYLEKRSEMIFLNADDDKLSKAASGIKTYTYSQYSGSDMLITLAQADPMVSVLIEDILIRSKLIGVYNFTNIAAAITIGNYFKIDIDKIRVAIETYSPANNRSQIVKKSNRTIILDAYNANPSSMSVAIDNFANLNASGKSVFLGDMFELGKEAESEHQMIVDLICKTKVDSIYLIGKNFFKTTQKDKRVKKYLSFEDLKDDWNTQEILGTVLIKGSRGMQLERILDILS